MVRMAGLEPAWPLSRQILSLMCIPIPPHSHAGTESRYRTQATLSRGPNHSIDTSSENRFRELVRKLIRITGPSLPFRSCGRS